MDNGIVEETRAGDPFVVTGKETYEGRDAAPHGCIGGVVYLSYEEDGEEFHYRVPCQGCAS